MEIQRTQKGTGTLSNTSVTDISMLKKKKLMILWLNFAFGGVFGTFFT